LKWESAEGKRGTRLTSHSHLRLPIGTEPPADCTGTGADIGVPVAPSTLLVACTPIGRAPRKFNVTALHRRKFQGAVNARTALHPDMYPLPSQNRITTPTATAAPRNPKQCPACGLIFSRWQDRDRHVLTHLPHWIHCPLLHCAWRGNRIKSIKLHWKRQDHLQYHESYGPTPIRDQFEIFDPQPFVNQTKAGTISASDAASQALIIVDVKADQLQKLSLSENPWGYKLKAALQ
jgi:uncharacterized C2H2 Zn-finger protein